MFIAITCNSSGRYGTSETNLENWLATWACKTYQDPGPDAITVGQAPDPRGQVGLALDEFQ